MPVKQQTLVQPPPRAAVTATDEESAVVLDRVWDEVERAQVVSLPALALKSDAEIRREAVKVRFDKD